MHLSDQPALFGAYLIAVLLVLLIALVLMLLADPLMRVIGVTGLRVIDASVMPTVVRANTHFTTVMIAEKMANLLASHRC